MSNERKPKLVVDLEPAVIEHLTFQDYSSKPTIDGVVMLPMRKFRQLEGSLMEYMRLAGGKLEAMPEFEVRQISIANPAPGRVNAFHLHPKKVQDEIWCVTAGELLVWLVDVRQGSPSGGVRYSCVLSGEAPSMLLIPTGVAHGFRAGKNGATMVYAMNSQFDPSDPNEGRLPWDYFGAELWAEDRG